MKCDECANYKPIDADYGVIPNFEGGYVGPAPYTYTVGNADMEGYRSQGEPYDIELTRDGAKVTARVWDMPEEVRGNGNHHILIQDNEYKIVTNFRPCIGPTTGKLFLRGLEYKADNNTHSADFPTVEAARDYFQHITPLIDQLNAEYKRPHANKWEHFVMRYTDAEEEVTKTFETWIDKSKPSSIHINGEQLQLTSKPQFDAATVRKLIMNMQNYSYQLGQYYPNAEKFHMAGELRTLREAERNALLAALGLDDA